MNAALLDPIENTESDADTKAIDESWIDYLKTVSHETIATIIAEELDAEFLANISINLIQNRLPHYTVSMNIDMVLRNALFEEHRERYYAVKRDNENRYYDL